MGRTKDKKTLDLEEKVRRLKALRALRTPSVPSKSHTKKPTGNDWTRRSLIGVPGGRGGIGFAKMCDADHTGTKVISPEKAKRLRTVAPPTTSFTYERGGFQRIEAAK